MGVLIRWLRNRKKNSKTLDRLATQVDQVDETLKLFYREQPLGLVIATLWHLVGYSVGILPLWYFLTLSTHDASFSTAACTYLLATWFDLVVFALPMTLGVLEGTRIIAFKAIGYSPKLGMTYGVAFRLAQLFWAGFGLINYRLLANKRIDGSKRRFFNHRVGRGDPQPTSHEH
jgi:hypothetical protein